MNGVCSQVIHLDLKVLKYYGGNYDTFIRTKMELDENQAKRYVIHIYFVSDEFSFLQWPGSVS